MAFPITRALTPDEFRAEIIDCYWNKQWPPDPARPTLQERIDADASCPASNKAELINDLCKIGSYLSNRDKVLQGLVRLENAIRTELARDARADLRGKVEGFAALRAQPRTMNRRNEPIIMKTAKLLSGVLGREEMRNGFNGLDGMGQPVARNDTLHSRSTVGVKDAQGNVVKRTGDNAGFQMAAGGRTASTPVRLPSGVPGMTGGVSGMDFQRILLRHGYQWKDVGAGALEHGEYTHRLQWYAITANRGHSRDLELVNTPLEIFRSMGCLFGRSTYPLPLEQKPEWKTFLWEAVLDCFSKKVSNSIAYANAGIYNCPDHLNMELSRISGAESPDFKSDPTNLYCLRVLMSARRTKRLATNPDPLLRLVNSPEKKVKEAFVQEGADAYLAWYVTE